MNCKVGGLFSVGFLLLLSGCGGPQGGGKSPDAVFDNLKSALKNKDYRTTFAQTTPESQDSLLTIFAAIAPIVAASGQETDRQNALKVEKILESYAVKKIDAIQQVPKGNQSTPVNSLTADVKDKPACLGEIFTLIDKIGKNDKNFYLDLEKYVDAKLSNVTIQGETATGTITVKRRNADREEAASFKRIEGLWFVDLAAMLQDAQRH